MSDEIIIDDVLASYKKIFNRLLKKWKQIVVVGVVSGILGFVIIWIQNNKFTAQLNFVSESSSSGGLSAYAGIASQFGFDIGGGGGGAFDGDNLIQLMKSRNLVVKTLLSKYDKKNLLVDIYIKNHDIKKNSLTHFKYLNDEQGWLEDSILNVVYKKISTKHLSVDKFDKKLDFVYVKYEDKDQFFAKKFVETLTENTIEFYTDYKTKKNSANVAVLQKQADSVRALLFGGIESIAFSGDLNVNPNKRSLAVPIQKKNVDNTVNAAIYTELQKNLQFAKLLMLKESPLIKIIDKPILPLKNEKMGRAIGFLLFGFIGALLACVWFVFSATTKKNEL